jgi:hypothetical protein
MRALCTPLLVLAASAASAQPAAIHARIDTRSAAAGLAPAFRALLGEQPAWIGYAVPMAGRAHMCCYDNATFAAGSPRCGGCRLEGDGSFSLSDRPVSLEASGRFMVLFRAAGGRVQKIRAFSEDCAIDAGGLPFHWLTDVRPAESVALVRSYLGTDRHLADSALAALAFHDAPEAVETMIQAARRDASTHLRGQALFWLSQRAGQRAAEAITDAIRHDPETEVKKKAVFALSQLPKDEAVPLLIRTARTNRNPEVRKQAVFWLGQSNDPRALAYFEEVLSR